MTSQDKNNKGTRQNRLRQILSGFSKHFSSVTSITLGGVAYTPATLTALIEADVTATDASVQAKANLATVVQTERNSHLKVDPVLRLLKSYVIAQFGDTKDASSTLADFGYTPRKSTKTTVATKSAAVAKSKATRDLLHTAGPKQKAKAKEAAAANPATAAPAPAPAPGPAAATAPASAQAVEPAPTAPVPAPKAAQPVP
jgi:hypothetical protein